MTYTIVVLKSSLRLIACVPDDEFSDHVISAAESDAGVEFDSADIAIECGLILTNDSDAGNVRYSVFDMGRLKDAAGIEFKYAVRRPVGRPSEMKSGKRVNVYLDAASLARAADLGAGNVSEGIRLALIAHPPAAA